MKKHYIIPKTRAIVLCLDSIVAGSPGPIEKIEEEEVSTPEEVWSREDNTFDRGSLWDNEW